MVAEAPANRSTIASYEECASSYAQSTAPAPGSQETPGLRVLLTTLPRQGPVLEIGSGPGWDADWLETRGVTVRRTDATQGFVNLQQRRGASAELLDVVSDNIAGPYVGVMALYVFQHFDRPQLPGVLAKVARALIPGGVLLFSIREGCGDLLEGRGDGNGYFCAQWQKTDLDAGLAELGFIERWTASHQDSEGLWLSILTCKVHPVQ
jgi:SAM-dependent methyltransferase